MRGPAIIIQAIIADLSIKPKHFSERLLVFDFFSRVLVLYRYWSTTWIVMLSDRGLWLQVDSSDIQNALLTYNTITVINTVITIVYLLLPLSLSDLCILHLYTVVCHEFCSYCYFVDLLCYTQHLLHFCPSLTWGALWGLNYYLVVFHHPCRGLKTEDVPHCQALSVKLWFVNTSFYKYTLMIDWLIDFILATSRLPYPDNLNSVCITFIVCHVKWFNTKQLKDSVCCTLIQHQSSILHVGVLFLCACRL